MTRAQRIVLGAALLILAGTHGALATISPSGIDARLRLDWEVDPARGGRPEVQGYVINDYMRPAINVRLLVETLDSNGQVTDRAYGFVVGAVPALSRAPFVVPLKTGGARYRISVIDFTWKDGGSAAHISGGNEALMRVLINSQLTDQSWDITNPGPTILVACQWPMGLARLG